MRLIIALFALTILSGCITTVEVTTYPDARPPAPGYLNDTQKWQRVQDRIGRVEYLSRGEMLRGTSRFSADIVRRRLVAQTGYSNWVCRQRRQYDVRVVRCARDDKLQLYVRFNDAEVFNMQLQPLLSFGAAPVFVDWGWR
tara:strand:+ start:2484 stop:2906 length:423 start_codon:yes stop_codon:yes gene_type:complete